MFLSVCGGFSFVLIICVCVVNSGERVNTKPFTWKSKAAPEDEMAAAAAAAAAKDTLGDEGDDHDKVM